MAVGLDRFDPRTVYARPGATVDWEWKTDGHNIVVRQRPDAAVWDGHETVAEAGYSYAYTFEVEGTYLYACDEHALVDEVAHARIVVTDDPSGSRRSDVVDHRNTSEVTVTVGPGGNLTFEPSAVRVSPRTTVRFVWDSDNHSIVVGEQPAGGTWNGHDAVEDAGFTHAHTFTATGRYEYWCEPHRTAGMEGIILVGADE